MEGSKRGGIGQPQHGFTVRSSGCACTMKHHLCRRHAGGCLKRALCLWQGQLHAIWTHRVTDREAAAIVGAHIPVLVLHGRYDILAMPRFGEQLARR